MLTYADVCYALQLVLGKKSPAECIEWDSNRGKATMWIMERDRAGVERRPSVVAVDVDAHFNFHYANAFECEETGDIVIDTVSPASGVYMSRRVCVCVCARTHTQGIYQIYNSHRFFAVCARACV